MLIDDGKWKALSTGITKKNDEKYGRRDDHIDKEIYTLISNSTGNCTTGTISTHH